MKTFYLQLNSASVGLALVVMILGFQMAVWPQAKTSIVSIAEAKNMPLGTRLNIQGSVTVASGIFRSSFDDYGFQIEDSTGGVYVSAKTDLHLTIGQKVRLEGTLSQTQLKFQIIETDESRVQVLPGKFLITPIAIKTGSIDNTTVGRLIKVTAIVTKPVEEVAPYGFRVAVDDNTGEIVAYVSTSTGISPKTFVAGEKVMLTGVAGRFNGKYQIYPRSAADVGRLAQARTKMKPQH